MARLSPAFWNLLEENRATNRAIMARWSRLPRPIGGIGPFIGPSLPEFDVLRSRLAESGNESGKGTASGARPVAKRECAI